MHSVLGRLYSVDPSTGEATAIDLGGALLTNGDGLLLSGHHTPYVVQNRLKLIAVVKLDPSFTSGEVVVTLTDSAFDVPTSIARRAGSFYVVNARFTTPPTPDTPYNIDRFPVR